MSVHSTDWAPGCPPGTGAHMATADRIEGIDAFFYGTLWVSFTHCTTKHQIQNGWEQGKGGGGGGWGNRQGRVNQTSRSQSQHRTNRSLDARWLCALQVVGKLQPARRLQKWMLLIAVCSCLSMYTVACLMLETENK